MVSNNCKIEKTKTLLYKSALVFLFALCNACDASNEDNTKSDTQKRFTSLLSSKTGINFINKIKDTEESNILTYANFYGGSGVGIGDFNNDGLQDIYFAGNLVADKLYLNKGNLKFEDITEKSGIQDDGGWSTGVTLADINNDGYLDIYVSRELYDDRPDWRKNLLYINNGDGTFEESAKQYGIDDDHRTRHATFLDYDKDGFLDLFLLTQPPNPGSYSAFFGTTLLAPEYHLKLFKNNGEGSFIDASEKAGIDLTGFPNGVSASDINSDGWTDLYVANDFDAPDFLFINNQNGTFTNIADKALKHTSYYSMGVEVADINNDSELDLFVMDMVAEDNFRSKSNMSGMDIESFWKVVEQGGGYQYMYNTVQLNNGNSTFSDVAQLTGMSATDWSWANLIADFDNDGLKDVYVTNGLLYDIRNTDADKAVANLVNKTTYDYIQKHPEGGNIESIWEILDIDDVIKLLPTQPLKNYAFKNKGDLNFEKVIDEWGLEDASFSNGAAYADLDNDGDLDLVVNNINAEAFLYKNNSETLDNNNYLRIKLTDSKNRPVFGTRIHLYSSAGIQMLETTNVRGIYSTSEALAHFGLGTTTKVDSILVQWPDGNRTVKVNPATNQVLEIAMNQGSLTKTDITLADTALFKEATATFSGSFTHKENDFDDFEKQILLPHKMSQFGPAIAVGDINNDGLEDFYAGGASGQSPTLFLQNNTGTFETTDIPFWDKEKAYEDIDALFVDVNNDGFKDLYVVSGGNAYPKNDFHYTDRIYINNGSGGFKKGAILNGDRASGSVVKAADYDNDGDLDIFVGGRHLPHLYPKPTSSSLLINDNGQLKNNTIEFAKELQDIGMVTDAVWADYDNDKDLDLILTGEWMAITVFKNENGQLAKVAIPSLESTKGWWFSLEQGDFDNDGDIDFIAGNLGLNYKYKTNPEKPFDIYYDDFDADGNGDIVLGYYNNEKHYPLRGFSCSSQQIPGLKDKIKKYDVFASLELKEVYGEDQLKNALHYKTDTFASSFIENMGDGSFKVKSLPSLAQLSNINDMLVKDYNRDGNLDILAIENLYVSEIETPRNDAGTGLLLLGNGKGGFSVKRGAEIGFYIPNDAKRMAFISVANKSGILVGNNDEKLQYFEVIPTKGK